MDASRWEWIDGRNPAIRWPITEIGDDYEGIPYLRPEIAFVLKAGQPAEVSTNDRAVISGLDPFSRRWLSRSLARLDLRDS